MYMSLMVQMFQGIVVDGSTSLIPGQFSAAANEEEREDVGEDVGTDTDGFENNPTSNSSRKRGTTTIADNPSNKGKTLLLKIVVNDVMQKFDEDNKVANKT